MTTHEQFHTTEKSAVSLFLVTVALTNHQYLRTKAPKFARKGKPEAVNGFYSTSCALSIKHS